jgi:predicted MFS family arabinose efflux permease
LTKDYFFYTRFFIPVDYLVKFGGSVLDLTASQSSTIITIIGAASAVGRVLVGVLAQQLSKAKFAILGLMVMMNGTLHFDTITVN